MTKPYFYEIFKSKLFFIQIPYYLFFSMGFSINFFIEKDNPHGIE